MCPESGGGDHRGANEKADVWGVPAKTIRAPKGERTVSATSPNVRKRARTQNGRERNASRPFRGNPARSGRKSYFRVTFCIMGMASSQVMPLSMNMRTVVPHGATVNM